MPGASELPCRDWQPILQAIITGPFAWQTPVDLAATLAMDVDQLTDRLADLDSAGWLEVWEQPDGVSVTLSAWAAARLGVKLAEGRTPGTWRWVPRDAPDPGPERARGVISGSNTVDLGLLIDAGVEAPAALASAEVLQGAIENPQRASRQDLYPTHLVGENLTPWPGPETARQDPPRCPACQDRPLSPRSYCLRCDRWGFDEAQRALRTPRSAPARHAPGVSPPLRSELEMAARAERSRRRARRRTRRRQHAQASDRPVSLGQNSQFVSTLAALRACRLG